MKRVTDRKPKVRFRANRFHRSNGYWYFVTREGINMGPFESKERAESQLTNYLEAITTVPANALLIPDRYRILLH